MAPYFTGFLYSLSLSFFGFAGYRRGRKNATARPRSCFAGEPCKRSLRSYNTLRPDAPTPTDVAGAASKRARPGDFFLSSRGAMFTARRCRP